MTSTIEETTVSAGIDPEGGVSLSKFTKLRSQREDEGDLEMFEGFDDEDEGEVGDEEDLDEVEEDDMEMSVALEQTDIADDTDENIERASQALPQLDPEATWIPPADSSAPQNELYTTKPTPYTYDLGNLAVYDPNPLPPNPSNHDLDATARAAAQALIGQLLTTRPIRRQNDSVLISLPPATTALPREKRLPTPKAKTKWQEFAEKKGIGGNKKKQGREGNLVFDEGKQEWVPRWGYKGKNKEGEGDWLVEVDPEKEGKEGEMGDQRKESRAARKERVRRNERRMRANERRAVQGRGLAS